MYYYFYKITNNINNKYYYGVHQTNDLDDGYMGSGTLIKKACNKYGQSNFSKEIIKFFNNSDEMYDYERMIVNKELLKDPNCYNLRCGGQRGFVGLIFTDEHKARMKENHADFSGEKNPFYGKTHSEEFSKTHSIRMTGRKASEKTKLKMSASKKGHLTSDITREKISKANKGRKLTEESRKHMSDAHKGKPASNKGKPMSEEQKDKLRKSLKGRKFINNGTTNKQVKESELSLFLNNGWSLGRLTKKK